MTVIERIKKFKEDNPSVDLYVNEDTGVVWTLNEIKEYCLFQENISDADYLKGCLLYDEYIEKYGEDALADF